MSPQTRRTAEAGGERRDTANGSQPLASAAWPVVAIALLLVIAWWAAFSVTGILWWGAPDDEGQRLAPPDPPHIQAADGDWISLDLYQRAQPRWQP